MPRSRYSPCTHCPELVDRTTGDCPNGCNAAKRKQAQQRTDASRPNAHQRGYDFTHRTRFRAGVLHRDPLCVICGAKSEHADHWPLTRTQLLARGLDPNDPQHGRGLCHSCHSSETARHDGGFGNKTKPDTTA